MVSVYWEYDLIASTYNGFTFRDLQNMCIRQREYWYAMSKWRTPSGG